METILLSCVGAGWVCFILTQIIVFRHILQRNVLTWMVVVFLGVGMIVSVALAFLLWSFPLLPFVVSYVLFWVLYGLCCLAYILAFFGIIESSIRIRILSEIAKGNERGITLEDLYVRYNRESIIKKRLERFLLSGDVTYEDKKYRLKTVYSPFSLPAGLFSFFWKLYRGDSC